MNAGRDWRGNAMGSLGEPTKPYLRCQRMLDAQQGQFRGAIPRVRGMPFIRNVTVRFDEADARGILFYGRLQELAHRVFEDFLVSEVVARWEDWFLSAEFIVPVRHAEATFHRPMRPGREYQAELALVKIGESSFDVRVRFSESSTEREPATAEGLPAADVVLCAETRVAHVFADAERFRKIAIPSRLRARLEAHLASE